MSVTTWHDGDYGDGDCRCVEELEAARAEIATLEAERDALKLEAVRVNSMLVVKLIDTTSQRNAAIAALDEFKRIAFALGMTSEAIEGHQTIQVLAKLNGTT